MGRKVFKSIKAADRTGFVTREVRFSGRGSMWQTIAHYHHHSYSAEE